MAEPDGEELNRRLAPKVKGGLERALVNIPSWEVPNPVRPARNAQLEQFR